jgi:formate dehydrogenase major subunit
MAENHPVAFRWVAQAKLKGATLIHVDPRFTRTSAMADLYVPIRSGTDIAFLGGLIRYVIENEKYFKDYVVNYTNAATIISDDFQDTEDLEGVFSGLKEAPQGSEQKYIYDNSSWQYKRVEPWDPAKAREEAKKAATFAEMIQKMVPPAAEKDPTLQHPRSVFQIVRRHFSRYTPEMVERITGCPQDLFLKVAEAVTANSGRERTTTFVYAMGWTQHTYGVQTIGTTALLQLLLGNMGRPGGGILALRGHATIQGSTDVPTLYHSIHG